MRIHRLDVTAFGPFADRVCVDLDALSDAGLFLLTGATGAGKTSVLDAVCFALYGAVPGDRQSAKRLRSDHAAPGVAPEVTMEFTVAGRRLLIERSPAWERAKKRGTGTTTEQARVRVTERVAGRWEPLATRLDEAGHLVSGLLGMNLTQFCQVQMLPQGRFQAFLRAGSDERHALLQKLFRTSRFEAVEAWLRDRRRQLRRRSAHHHELVADLVSRVSEASGRPLPDGWDLHALVPAVTEVAPWADARCAEASERSRHAVARAADAAQIEAVARQRLEEARRLADRRLRLRRALAERDALRETRAGHDDRVTRLDASRRAAAVTPLGEAAARAQADLDAARAAADASTSRAAVLLGTDGPTEEELRVRQQQAAAGAAAAGARQPLVDERLVVSRERDATVTAMAAVADRLERLGGRLRVLPDEVAACRHTEAEIQRAADRLPGARLEVEVADSRLAAGHLVAELIAERSQAEARHREAVDQAQDLRERWLALQELRLTGMAAEIAGALAVGASCPVCGSHDHPHPARPMVDAPDAVAEREARRAVDDAEASRHAHAGAVRDLDLRIAHAREQAGHRTVPVLEREAADAAAVVARLAARADGLPEARAAREAAEREHDEATDRRTRLLAEQAALATTRDAQTGRLAALTAELDALLAGTGFGSVPELRDHLAAVADACTAALRDLAERARAEQAAADAGTRAAAAARQHGFDSPAEAAAAALPAADVAELDRQVRSHEHRLAAVDATLADPELQDAAGTPAADPAALEAAQAEAAAELSEARASRSVAESRLQRLERLRDELTAALADWEPLRDELELAERLASLADGTSADNRLRMRLSGYVLAFRLRQVVGAANERLVGMTDGRYRLEHSGDRGAGETRGGLSLRVRDDWTGESRDPVTLSGGETFVASLALALGLADVITFEAGGAELDTLFVDEGFGTLDAETLDDVMDTLDSLRDGGRVVGVVSHVAELRDRIPAQLHVRKQRTGSTLHQAAVG